MSVLALLLSKTLSKYSKGRNDQVQKLSSHQNEKTSVSSDCISSSESFVKLMKRAATQNTKGEQSQSSKNIESISTVVEKTSTYNKISANEIMFIQNVRERIAIPLSILCKLIPSQKSIPVQKTGILSLCKTILVDTFMTWNVGLQNENVDDDLGNSMKLLHESAFECVITMLDDCHEEGMYVSTSVFTLFVGIILFCLISFD